MSYANPKSNIAFKKIFANEQHKNVAMSLINAVLHFEGDERICDLEITDPYQAPRLEGLKETTLDLQATDKAGRSFIVEMQVGYDPYFDKRAFYYVSKACQEQLPIGGKYRDIKPIYFIAFLDYNLFKDDTDFFRSYSLRQDQKTENKLDLFSLVFVELEKFTKQLNELTDDADKWCWFFNHATELEQIPEQIHDQEIVEALTLADQHTWSKEEMNAYIFWEFERQKEENLEEYAEQQKDRADRAETEKQQAEADKQQAEHALDKAASILAEQMNISIKEAKELLTQ